MVERHWRVRVYFDNLPLAPPPDVNVVTIAFKPMDESWYPAAPEHIHTIFDAIQTLESVHVIRFQAECIISEVYMTALAECISNKLPPNVDTIYSSFEYTVESINVSDGTRKFIRHYSLHPMLERVIGSLPAQIHSLHVKRSSMDNVVHAFHEHGGGNVRHLTFQQCEFSRTQDGIRLLAELIRKLTSFSCEYMDSGDDTLDWSEANAALSTSPNLQSIAIFGNIPQALVPTTLPPNLKQFDFSPYKNLDLFRARFILAGEWPKHFERIMIGGKILDWDRRTEWERSVIVQRFRKVKYIHLLYGPEDNTEFFRELFGAPNHIERIAANRIWDLDLIEILEMEHCNLIDLKINTLNSIEERSVLPVIRRCTRIRKLYYANRRERFVYALGSDTFHVIQTILSVRYAPRIAPPSSLLGVVPWETLTPMISDVLGWGGVMDGLTDIL